jgi:hypothetical protein
LKLPARLRFLQPAEAAYLMPEPLLPTLQPAEEEQILPNHLPEEAEAPLYPNPEEAALRRLTEPLPCLPEEAALRRPMGPLPCLPEEAALRRPTEPPPCLPEEAALRRPQAPLLYPRPEAEAGRQNRPRPEAAEPFLHLRPAAVVTRNHLLLKLREK